MTHYQKFFLIEGIVSHVYNLKSSLKFNYYWHFGGNIIDQKCSYEKVTKNWAGSSPPPHLEKSIRTATFFVKPSLRTRCNINKCHGLGGGLEQ